MSVYQQQYIKVLIIFFFFFPTAFYYFFLLVFQIYGSKTDIPLIFHLYFSDYK